MRNVIFLENILRYLRKKSTWPKFSVPSSHFFQFYALFPFSLSQNRRSKKKKKFTETDKMQASSESAAFPENTVWLTSDITRNSSLSAAWFSEKEAQNDKRINKNDTKFRQGLLSSVPGTRNRVCRHFQDTSSRQAAHTIKNQQLRTDPGE